MKKLLILGTLAILNGNVALAADLPATGVPVYSPLSSAPVTSWTGFYAGVNGGWISARWSTAGVGGSNANSFVGGGTFGYNYELPNKVVLGVEGDIDASSANRKATTQTQTIKISQSYIGTVRARIGYDLGTFLPYVTGGLAVGGSNLKYTDTAAPTTNFSRNQSKAGWAVGAGVEALLGSNWTAKIEYLYADLGQTSYGGAVAQKISLRDHLVRIGLNYRF